MKNIKVDPNKVIKSKPIMEVYQLFLKSKEI